MTVDCWIEAHLLNPGKPTGLDKIQGSPTRRPQTSVTVLR